MRTIAAAAVATFCAVTATLITEPRRGEASVYAAQLYPYCQVSSASGGMNCYISSMDQCEYRESCINNPWYLGEERAREWKRKNKPQWRWW
jgi:hypothetical protein